MNISKERFVKEKLSPLLAAAYPEVLGAFYQKTGAEESVMINYNDGVIIAVNVTGDSLPALIQDVVNKIIFN